MGRILPWCPSLHTLKLWDADLTSTDVSHLAYNTSLRTLMIHQSHFMQGDPRYLDYLGYLQQLEELRILDVLACPSLSFLRYFKSLRSLIIIDGNGATTLNLGDLARSAETLQTLRLVFCNLEGSLEELSRLRNLRELQLDSCMYKNAELGHVTALSTLRKLNRLKLYSFTLAGEPETAQAIQSLTRLTALTLVSKKPGSRGFNPGALTHLRSLECQAMSVSKGLASVLPTCTELEVLHLHVPARCAPVTLSDEDKEVIRQHPSLTSFVVDVSNGELRVLFAEREDLSTSLAGLKIN